MMSHLAKQISSMQTHTELKPGTQWEIPATAQGKWGSPRGGPLKRRSGIQISKPITDQGFKIQISKQVGIQDSKLINQFGGNVQSKNTQDSGFKFETGLDSGFKFESQKNARDSGFRKRSNTLHFA